MQLAIFSSDQPAKQESAGWARYEDVAIERQAVVVRIKPLAPNLVSGAVVAIAGRDRHGNLTCRGPWRDDQRLFLRCCRTIGAKHGDNRELAAFGVIDQIGGIDAKRLGNAIEPTDRDRTGTGFKAADGLRGGGRRAGPGDVVQRHAACAADLSDACNHDRPNTLTNQYGFALSYKFSAVAREKRLEIEENCMPKRNSTTTRLLAERPIEGDAPPSSSARRSARSVTVNLAESPLGWLFARGHVNQRQYDAGERLRQDWERGQLSQRVTMAWDSAPLSRSRGGSRDAMDLGSSQLDAKRRFEAAVSEAGPGLSDILWRVVCAGEGMRDAETALGWPTRAGKLVLGIALDRVADYYRIR
jgi:hypothetical protein